MSKQRRERRKQQRMSQGYLTILSNYLSQFYDFLESEVKPTDEEVRETFILYRDKWYEYCTKNKLTDYAKDLFTMNVEKMWEHKAGQVTA